MDHHGQWNFVGSTFVPRRHHGCGVLKIEDKEVVVAAGGSLTYVNTDTVEFLWIEKIHNDVNIDGSSWEFGPKLPITLGDAASATTEDQTRLYLVGGTVLQWPYEQSSSIFHLGCEGAMSIMCTWTRNDMELVTARSAGLAMILPPFSKLLEGGFGE